MLLHIKVIPKSSKNSIDGWENGRLRVRIRGVPEKGKANEALIEFLAEELKIAKSRITIVSGQTSRLKRIQIDGVDEKNFQFPP